MKKESIKIIALSCSPSVARNSDSMLDFFIEGIREALDSDCDVEKIYLQDILIDYYSYENKNGPQLHEKEFKKLTNKIQHSAGLIIATPTYNFSVPANLKNFIDRIRFFALDFENKNKLGQPIGKLKKLNLYFLVSGGTPKWAQIILFFAFPSFWLRNVFLYYGARCIGAYYSGDINTFKNEAILRICKKLGKKYAKKIMARSYNGILGKIFWRPPQKGKY